MTAKDFSIYWTNFISQNCTSLSDWPKYYNDNNLWTKITIGSKCSEEINSPFGDFLKNVSGLRYRKEDGLTDLAFAENNFFNKVYSLHKAESERKEVLPQNAFCPKYYDILVEHENSIYLCYQEMIKFTYIRARLKVLITYNENVDDCSDYRYANDILFKNFNTIIRQATERCPENIDTEYLLIIGQLNNENLNWSFYIFDYKGDLINI
jgi:hypothetical protein